MWLAFHRMRAGRELACDETVLARLDRNGARMYGHTILDMAELISSGVGYAAYRAGRSRSQIADRISMISRFGGGSLKASVVSIMVTMLGETRKYYRFRESDHPYALIFLYDTDWDYLDTTLSIAGK